MRLRFTIHYKTQGEERLHVFVESMAQEGRPWSYDLPMQSADGIHWTLETSVLSSHFPDSSPQSMLPFTYCYQVADGEGMLLRREWCRVPRVCSCVPSRDYIFSDEWRDVPFFDHLYTKAGRVLAPYLSSKGPVSLPSLYSSHTVFSSLTHYRQTIILQVSAPQLREGEVLAVTGDHPALGNWNLERTILMTPMGGGEYICSFEALAQDEAVEYKYVVLDERTHLLRQWEDGENRSTAVAGSMPAVGEVLVIHGGQLRVKEDVLRVAGVTVPLFSLVSSHSCGVGDFGDLCRLVDWASSVGMRAIQLLPLNDTTTQHSWFDSTPYNCISSFALHPHYLDLEQLEPLSDEQSQVVFHRQQSELNALDYVDYMAVQRVKGAYINKVYQQNGVKVLESDDFQSFFDENKSWLIPYAAFCVLRDKFGTARVSDWKGYATYRQEQVEALHEVGSPFRDAIREQWYVQYHLHRQLGAAVSYAHQKGVMIKGDLPVSVYRDSVDTWMYPDAFHLDMQLGTPPLPSCPKGQNWGFPVLREQQTEKWWNRRLAFIGKYVDAVRLDHIISFFCSWEIPSWCVFGYMGHPSPAYPLSEEEIRRFGIPFDRRLHTRPYITDQIVDELFGEQASYVRRRFLSRKARGYYVLLPEVDTQMKIQSLFGERCDGQDRVIRDGLYRLCANVLFVEDSRQWGMFHPRFGAQLEPAFLQLGENEQKAYLRMYHYYFFERHNHLWEQTAQRRLASLQRNTDLLFCAEDLGLLPHGVARVLDAQRILSLEVQVYPKNGREEFALLEKNPYRSVDTTSTHDMPSLRLWWEQDQGRAQRFFNEILHKEGKAPRILPPRLAEEILTQHLNSPSMLCLLPIQDWLAVDGSLRQHDVGRERVNEPSDAENKWQYRMPVTLERLMSADSFNRKVGMMIRYGNRA